jgi:hypothetical protein
MPFQEMFLLSTSITHGENEFENAMIDGRHSLFA